MIISFKCPKCGSDNFEEVLADVIVATSCILLEHKVVDPGCGPGYELQYGEQTCDGGHVDRYQCSHCGYCIIDHNSLHCEEGLNALALAKALKELAEATETQQDENDPVTHEDLVQQIAESFRGLTGEEMMLEWSRIFPGKEIVYESDSLYHWKADEPSPGVSDSQG